jgi:23S rRNA pseudouridine1911/1915/1917 synthase
MLPVWPPLTTDRAGLAGAILARMDAPRRFRVPPQLSGERLDRALVELLAGDLSRTRVKELIGDGGVSLDGAPATRPAQLLEEGQEIELREVASSRIRPGGPVGAELVVVYEDAHLAVVDKPAGTLSHPTSIVRGGTVSELAEARWGSLPCPQGEDRPGIVHRLDAESSGLMVVALDDQAAEGLVQAFRARRIEKRYLALVHGDPRFDSDWIETPLGRSTRHPDRMSVLPEGEGREAATFYRVLERFGRFALVECRPRTGRTHQIRVHLTSIEHPLVGDGVYPGRVRHPLPKDAPPLDRHLLHAAGLTFSHPVTGAELELESPLPREFEAWLAYLRPAG